MTTLAIAIVGLAALALLLTRGIETSDLWSIGMIRRPRGAAEPLTSLPAAELTLRAQDVTDVDAGFVADPFLFADEGRWWLFFEVFSRSLRRGVLSCASSPDGRRWTYEREILREPFHLSYPYVLRHGDEHFLIPESAEAGAVRLYRADRFPFEWRFERTLLSGPYLDSSVFEAGGRWWMLATRAGGPLQLFHADDLRGPWAEHPASPVCTDPRHVRSGGRVVRWQGRLVRFAQDGTATYGRSLSAFEIITLTPTAYAERPLADAPLVAASGTGWNADGMHHLDPVALPEGDLLAATDGKRIVRRLNWRMAVRSVLPR